MKDKDIVLVRLKNGLGHLQPPLVSLDDARQVQAPLQDALQYIATHGDVPPPAPYHHPSFGVATVIDPAPPSNLDPPTNAPTRPPPKPLAQALGGASGGQRDAELVHPAVRCGKGDKKHKLLKQGKGNGMRACSHCRLWLRATGHKQSECIHPQRLRHMLTRLGGLPGGITRDEYRWAMYYGHWKGRENVPAIPSNPHLLPKELQPPASGFMEGSGKESGWEEGIDDSWAYEHSEKHMSNSEKQSENNSEAAVTEIVTSNTS